MLNDLLDSVGEHDYNLLGEMVEKLRSQKCEVSCQMTWLNVVYVCCLWIKRAPSLFYMSCNPYLLAQHNTFTLRLNVVYQFGSVVWFFVWKDTDPAHVFRGACCIFVCHCFGVL